MEESRDYIFKERLVSLLILFTTDLLNGYQELQWAVSLSFFEELPEELQVVCISEDFCQVTENMKTETWGEKRMVTLDSTPTREWGMHLPGCGACSHV